MKTKIGKRIRGFRRFLGLSQKEFGQKLGLSFQHISRYERGKIIPSGEILAKICEIYNINLNWLLTGDRARENESLPDSFVTGNTFISSDPVNKEELEHHMPNDMFLQGFLKPSITVVKVCGHGMEPHILEGAYVGVDTRDKRVISGEPYAVRLQHEGIVIKRLYVDFKRLIFKSDNPSFPEFSITLEELPKDFIIGRIKWIIQKFY